jgi:hypothetical protein
MALSFPSNAPLQLNGEQVNVNVKRNALDLQNSNNWANLSSHIAFNPLVAGTGWQNDEIGTAVIKPRNLSKQMGSKSFYYVDPVSPTSYSSIYLPTWDIIGAGSSYLNFTSNATQFTTVTTPLAITVADNNSTIELDIGIFSANPNGYDHRLTTEWSTSPTFASITGSRVDKFFCYSNINQQFNQPRAIISGLTAGTYYFRQKINFFASSYGVTIVAFKSWIDYEVSNATFN